jgi:hypothetical protein
VWRLHCVHACIGTNPCCVCYDSHTIIKSNFHHDYIVHVGNNICSRPRLEGHINEVSTLSVDHSFVSYRPTMMDAIVGATTSLSIISTCHCCFQLSSSATYMPLPLRIMTVNIPAQRRHAQARAVPLVVPCRYNGPAPKCFKLVESCWRPTGLVRLQGWIKFICLFFPLNLFFNKKINIATF